jgi:hypothetical protein
MLLPLVVLVAVIFSTVIFPPGATLIAKDVVSVSLTIVLMLTANMPITSHKHAIVNIVL